MAFLTVRLASGRSMVIDSSVCPTVADASNQICHELNVPNGCAKLIASSGCELNNEDHIGAMCLAGVTAVILQDKLLEARITEAVKNRDFMAANALLKQLEALQEPVLPEIDTGIPPPEIKIQLATMIQQALKNHIRLCVNLIFLCVKNRDYEGAVAFEEQLRALKKPAVVEMDAQLETMIQAHEREEEEEVRMEDFQRRRLGLYKQISLCVKNANKKGAAAFQEQLEGLSHRRHQ